MILHASCTNFPASTHFFPRFLHIRSSGGLFRFARTDLGISAGSEIGWAEVCGAEVDGAVRGVLALHAGAEGVHGTLVLHAGLVAPAGATDDRFCNRPVTPAERPPAERPQSKPASSPQCHKSP